MANQLVHFFKGAFIQQQIDAFAGRELALFVHPRAAFFSASRLRRGVAAANFL
jgi:hypothetical protein